jgi:DNA repair protein RadC
MVEAGKLLDVSVLDHLIVAENRYFSFADEGLI